MDDHEQMLREVELMLIRNPNASFEDYPEDLTWEDLAEVEGRIVKKAQELYAR